MTVTVVDLAGQQLQVIDVSNPGTTPGLQIVAGPPGAGGPSFTIDTDYGSLAAALTATSTGGILEVRGTYSVSSPFTINKACTVRFARGASITATSGHAIDVTASDVTLERPKVIGSGSGTAGTSIGIRAVGTVGTPITNLYLTRPNVSAFNKYGIYLEQVTDFSIDRPVVTNIAYGGIMMLSCIRGRIAGGAVQTLTMPSGFTNSYGIAMTRDSTQSLAVAPRSSCITVDGVFVSGVTQWEGIDTHAGTDLTIVNNIVQNCKVGIALVPCDNESAVSTYAPQRCLVIGNTVDAKVSDGSRSNGISVVGAGVTNGSPVESAMGCTVANNTVIDHGNQVNHSSGEAGAILAYFTQSLSVIGNTVIRPGVAGVQCYHSNNGAVLLGNTIEDAWTTDAAFSAAVYVRSSFNSLSIGGTRIVRGAKSATIVNGRGLSVSLTTSNEILETGSNNWATATLPTSGASTLLKFQLTAPLLGLYGATPVAKATISGARADGTALSSVLSALGALGVVTDSSTAGSSAQIDVFTSSGTYTKPANPTLVEVFLISAGGGGGSGRRDAAGTVRCGGGAGGGGGVTRALFDPADLTATVAVTVGTAGAGGAAVTADATNGNAGSAGTATLFGAYATASPGAAGAGGTTSTGTGGSAGIGTSTSGVGAAASTTGLVGAAAAVVGGCSGGGSGGGITSANVASNGGAASQSRSVGATAGTGGVVDGAAPSPAAASAAKGAAGPGGPGGASSITTAAQAGATPGGYGGGGGGGGASLNGNNSGAGGTGAPGYCLVITRIQ